MNTQRIMFQISNAIQTRASRSVFLGVRKEGPRLSFGSSTTTQLEFYISLHWPGGNFVTDSNAKGTEFTLMLNQGHPNGPLQLILFGTDSSSDPLLVYEGEDADCPSLSGQVLILATSPSGQDHAALSIVFDGRGYGSYLSADTVEAGLHFKLLFDLYHQRALCTEDYGEDGDDGYDFDESNIFTLQ